LDNANPFYVSQQLRYLEVHDVTGRQVIPILRRERILELLPQEPPNVQGLILSLCNLPDITMNDLLDHKLCLDRICKGDLLEEVRKLYKTVPEVREPIHRLVERADFTALIQEEIDPTVQETGVTQQAACEFLGRKDYVGLIQHFLKNKPFIPSAIPRSDQWLERLDEQIGNVIALLTTTWTPKFLWPSTWTTLSKYLERIYSLGPKQDEVLERIQIVYQTKPAIKGHIDRLLNPGWLNPDSLTKKKLSLLFIHQQMNSAIKKFRVPQEEFFSLLGQKRYPALIKRILSPEN